MSTSTAAVEAPKGLRWYQGLDRYCWVVLIVAALGWMFDTMDQNLFNLVRAPSLRDILGHQYGLTGDALKAAVDQKAGLLTAIFLIGWSAGGFLFGIIGDRLGRTNTMIATILTYAIFTGLNGSPLVKTWEMYGVMRFLTALGVGGEWAAGAALVAEVFPDRSRGMALGLLQSLSAVGNMTAALITRGMGDLEANWRYVFFVGALPALVVLWVRRSVKEPEKWHEAKAAAGTRELGNILELFRDPTLRRNTIAAMLMAAAGVGTLWGVAFFSPEMVRNELTNAGLDGKTIGIRISDIFLLQNAGAFPGAMLFAALAERVNRRTAFFLWFALAWGAVLAFFWGLQGAGAEAFNRALFLAPLMGFCTLGPFAGYTVYFPELFPTRLRATGCGFGYNAARVLAAAAPFTLGQLRPALGGYAQAASVVLFILLLGFIGTAMAPETKGKPLPE